MARFRVRRGHLGGCVFPRVRDGRRARRAVRAAGRTEGEEEDVRGGGGARESRGEAALEADAAFVQERHGAPRVPGDVVRVDGGQLPPTQKRDSGRRDGSRENRAVHLGDGARADDASARAAPVPGDRAAHHPRPLEARDGEVDGHERRGSGRQRRGPPRVRGDGVLLLLEGQRQRPGEV